MSPFRPVVVKTRRGVVLAALVAALAFPSASYLAGSRVHETADTTDETAQLARQVQALSVRTAADARATTSALCVLRDDLQARVDGSRAFLRKHPGGFSGVSAKEIRDAAANQQRTIAALSGINCP